MATLVTVSLLFNIALELLASATRRGKKKKGSSWIPWLTPVIPAFWETEVGQSPEVRSSRPAWPTW